MISTQRIGNVLVITMDDGENRFNAASLSGFEAALDEVDRDASITAVVTTGAGKFYSNGFDIELLGGPDSAAYYNRAIALEARLLELPLVTVCAINGHAFGAGAMLALTHDVRVMREDRGYFCLPEVDLGMPFPPFMSALLQTKLSRRTAQEAMTLGLRYGGKQALDAGIVHALGSEVSLLDDAVSLAAERGGKNRDALGVIKADLYGPVLQHRP